MAKLELYGIRLNPIHTEIVNEFVQRMDGFHLVTLHKLDNGEIEMYTYKEGVNRFSYDTFTKFEHKLFMVGYMKGANDALNCEIHFC